MREFYWREWVRSSVEKYVHRKLLSENLLASHSSAGGSRATTLRRNCTHGIELRLFKRPAKHHQFGQWSSSPALSACDRRLVRTTGPRLLGEQRSAGTVLQYGRIVYGHVIQLYYNRIVLFLIFIAHAFCRHPHHSAASLWIIKCIFIPEESIASDWLPWRVLRPRNPPRIALHISL